MSPRLLASALPVRAGLRYTSVAAARHLHHPRSMHTNLITTNLPKLVAPEQVTSTQVQSSHTLGIAKWLSQQSKAATSAQPRFSWPVDVFAKSFEENRKLYSLRETSSSFEELVRESLKEPVKEQVKEELWLERFGGPGKSLEKVAGSDIAVLREEGPDGKGILRVLV
ncbi:hypothetical protein E8E13_010693 [Curvularia kusanoi]|uniref:Uncharacterized protein n=1 Tax=Curvularia kusanoi TaxID=90978 RepID=A0A9P4TP29_CURKU|nr:hypothetical protein E8E13_010693 [Curvularia kusanoi]